MAQGMDDATAKYGRLQARGEIEPSDATLLLHAESLDIKKHRISEQVVVKRETCARDLEIAETLQVKQIVVEHVMLGAL